MGGTSEFRATLAGEEAAPEATKARLAIESQERLLTGRKKVILPRGSGGRSQLWFGAGPPGTTGAPAAAAAPSSPPVSSPATSSPTPPAASGPTKPTG